MKKEIEKLLGAIVADYAEICEDQERVEQFANGLEVKEGKKYMKVIKGLGNQRCVWGFIVKEDGGKFVKGDILKAAGWAAPALNQARGNNFDDYNIEWTGPAYRT